MSIYAFAEQMMTRQAKQNPFLALMPGMEPLQKTTQTWMRGMGLPVGSDTASDVGTIEASVEAAMNAMPEFDGLPNLAVHPMAAMAAGTAVSMGAASHAMGAMFGAMTGMMENAARLQKATRESSVFAPPGLEITNPLKFDWTASTAHKPASTPKAQVAKPVSPAKPKLATSANSASQAASKAKVAAKAATPAKRVAEPAVPRASKPKAAAAKAVKAAPAPAPKVAAKPTKANTSAKKDAAPVKAKQAAAASIAKANADARPSKATPGVAKATAPVPAAEPVAATMPARPGGVAPAAILPEDFKQPKKMAKPSQPDDLKQISGVGPKLEQVLNGLGIWRFKQIAGWTRAEVAWIDDYLQFSGRIERDNWIAQAKKLAKDKTSA